LTGDDIDIDQSIIKILQDIYDNKKTNIIWPQISFKFNIPNTDFPDTNIVIIQFILPQSHISDEKLRLSLLDNILTKTQQDDLLSQLRLMLYEENENSCFEIIQTAINVCQDFQIFNKENNENIMQKKNSKNFNVFENQKLMQILIYFHHIKSNMKKQVIRENAVELSLGMQDTYVDTYVYLYMHILCTNIYIYIHIYCIYICTF
jgi:hypothetical protein